EFTKGLTLPQAQGDRAARDRRDAKSQLTDDRLAFAAISLALILEVKAQTYSFEAGNVRHEHEWRIWQQTKLPAGKMLMPGVVSHATNLVEHPALVADRILRDAKIGGRENVVAGTDCGLGGRVHTDLVWAKLRTLVEGARLASTSLWTS